MINVFSDTIFRCQLTGAVRRAILLHQEVPAQATLDDLNRSYPMPNKFPWQLNNSILSKRRNPFTCPESPWWKCPRTAAVFKCRVAGRSNHMASIGLLPAHQKQLSDWGRNHRWKFGRKPGRWRSFVSPSKTRSESRLLRSYQSGCWVFSIVHCFRLISQVEKNTKLKWKY